VKLYLLYNGRDVWIMATTGHQADPDATPGVSAKLRDFFGQGTRKEILEAKIRPEANRDDRSGHRSVR
jgi:hypothetical protein